MKIMANMSTKRTAVATENVGNATHLIDTKQCHRSSMMEKKSKKNCNKDDLDVMGRVHGVHMCDDNTICPIPRYPVNEYEIWKTTRVIIDSRGRKKITTGEEFGAVYSARVVDRGGKSSLKIHGHILLKSGLGDTYLFGRKQENPLAISRSHDMIPLFGPIVATFGEDWGAIIILKDGDDEFCKGVIAVCPPHYRGVRYNYPMTRKFRGSNGCTALEVNYATYRDAVLAEVQIKLIEDQNIPCKIFGSVIARIDNDKKLTSTVFNKNVDQSVTLGPEHVIQLSRPLLSVPRSSYLLIKVDLWDSNQSPHKPIVQGSLRFEPEYFGEDVWLLPDDCPKIEVKVTWFSFPDHQKSMARFCLNPKLDVSQLCTEFEETI